MISEITGYNIIVDDDVRGTITIKLIEVPVDQAFEAILETKGLGKVMIGEG